MASSNFTKISGFKKVGRCRLCKKRIVMTGYNYYCDECLEKVRK